MRTILSFFLLFHIPLIWAEGYWLTPNEFWIKAEIETEEKGIIEAIWNQKGTAVTERGDTVIWGYFYADPNDVDWGNKDNPDLFVKAWFDINGRIDINYFHVSVPNIYVHSIKNGNDMLSSTITMQERYARHSFYPAGTQGRIVKSTEQGEIATVTFDREEANISALQRSVIINTEEKGWISAIDNMQGSNSTQRGDFVIWGYFYADPKDVTWGNINNPEVFYKIWWDISGRIDVNFFHVSVPDMEVWSEFTYLTQKQHTLLNLEEKRYTRHEYFPEEIITWVDSDDDGVPDHRDNCPGTSPEDLVLGIDLYGCPKESNDTYYD